MFWTNNEDCDDDDDGYTSQCTAGSDDGSFVAHVHAYLIRQILRVCTTPGFNTIRRDRLARRMQKRRKTRDRVDYHYYSAFKRKRKCKNISTKNRFLSFSSLHESMSIEHIYNFRACECCTFPCVDGDTCACGQWCTLFSASTTYCHNKV